MKTLLGVICAAVFASVLVPTLSANELDKKTIVTFPDPVQIPGKVLTPGEYVIKRPYGRPDVVQFLNDDETHVYATVLARPTYRSSPSDQPEFRFEERPGGNPDALKEWYYPGTITGAEFIYPSGPSGDEFLLASAQGLQSREAAPGDQNATKATAVESSPLATEPDELAAESEAPVPQAAPEENVEIAQATPPPSSAAQPAQQPSPATPQAGEPQPGEPAAQRLPQTATNLPAVAFLGVLAIGLGAGLRRLLRHGV